MLLFVTESQDSIATFSKLPQILESGIGAHRSFSNQLFLFNCFYGGKYYGAQFLIHGSA